MPNPAPAPTGTNDRAPQPPRGRLGWALAAVAAVAGVVLLTRRSDPPLPATPDDHTVAVVALDNLTGDPASDPLAARAGEAVAAGLGKVPGVHARSLPRTADPGAEAKRQGAGWVFAGSVQRAGQVLRLAAYLHPTDGAASTEPIEVEGAPGEADRLVDTLRVRAVDEARLALRERARRDRAVRGTEHPEARDALLRYEAKVGPRPGALDLDEGKRLLDEALTKDPAYVPALVERAYLQSIAGSARNDAALHAAALADLDRALAASPTDAEALGMRCRVRQVQVEAEPHPMDAARAAVIEACTAARTADPASAYVLLSLARHDDAACQYGEAVQALEQALPLDRGLSTRILEPLVRLALQEDRLDAADRRSQELVAFEEEQRALGPKAVSRRSGIPPAAGAHLLRAAVLLRLGRAADARPVLEKELGAASEARGEAWAEAAALRGLVRVAKENGATADAPVQERLAALEYAFEARAATDPGLARIVAGAYQWIDPAAAVTWIEKSGAPASFADGFGRALLYQAAGKPAEARKALAAAAPTQAWERRCATWMEARLGR